MNAAEIRLRQEVYKAFLATPLGKAFDVWEKAHAAYWQADGNPDVFHKRLVNLAQHEKAVYEDLLSLLYASAGVGR